MDRRDFCKCVGSAFVLSILGCGRSEQPVNSFYRFGYMQTNYLRPPGALPEAEFVKACINCDLCAQVCDREAIRFFSESFDGRVEPHTPYIIAAESACDLCLECSKVCPTGALMPVEKMEDVDMGLAVLDEKLCLPYLNQGGCGACYTVCPVNAVRLDMQRYPKVIDERCVGCGLCEEICLQQVKAIRVVKT